jgi:hypothetical protein
LLAWDVVGLVLHVLDRKWSLANAEHWDHTIYVELLFKIGSLIFSKTEGWSYGVAMYFCELYYNCIILPDTNASQASLHSRPSGTVTMLLKLPLDVPYSSSGLSSGLVL